MEYYKISAKGFISQCYCLLMRWTETRLPGEEKIIDGNSLAVALVLSKSRNRRDLQGKTRWGKRGIMAVLLTKLIIAGTSSLATFLLLLLLLSYSSSCSFLFSSIVLLSSLPSFDLFLLPSRPPHCPPPPALPSYFLLFLLILLPTLPLFLPLS